ncbi:MAG TPA: nuclear transport factor 2 family protein [Pyrinomonadaceae bacterium]|jgi:ketosteroid isomerase-like protein|nr:nuclear transport factor 2 family protein [Pyrinomonadaceae bacterium]
MLKVISLFFVFALTCGFAVAQNSNSSTTTERQRTTNTNRARPTPSPQTEKAAPAPKQAAAKKPASSAEAPGAEGVNAAFNELMDGIRHADVNAVTGVYWNDRRLNLFNYNGSVTKGWDQVRKNRESSYPEIKDVKLDVRDISITMLGPSGAVVTCLWTQSQNYKGVPETASGRMTLVFKRIGTAWKAIHLHSSPDSPNPAAIPPSEQRPAPSPSPTP